MRPYLSGTTSDQEVTQVTIGAQRNGNHSNPVTHSNPRKEEGGKTRQNAHPATLRNWVAICCVICETGFESLDYL